MLPLPATSAPPLEFPHPLITEILYAVPAGAAGDANRDGTRDACGDEFIELTNPHDRPIQLQGYMLTDRNPGKAGLRFAFPSLELAPGQTVVVFNGHAQTWSGPVGDSSRAPEAPHDTFHGAFVFTIRAASSRVGFANGGDYLLLTSPGNEPIHLITWGEFEEKPPAAALVEEAPKVTNRSITRADAAALLAAHPGDPFSPGLFPAGAKPATR